MRQFLPLIVIACLTLPCVASDPVVLTEVDPAIKKAEADFASKWASAEKRFDNDKKKAQEERVKVYKDRLAYHTKNGDFDKAAAVKAAIESFEVATDGATRPKPPTVQYEGHEYALIKEKVTWHIAKQRCEEMGGHVVVLNDLKEDQFVCQLVGNESAYVGCSDEEQEGKWEWVRGTKYLPKDRQFGAGQDVSHFLVRHRRGWHDGPGSVRHGYVCEWE